MKKTTQKALFNAWVSALMFSGPASVSLRDIEGDGRKQVKAARDLEDQGYVVTRPNENPTKYSSRLKVEATEKAFDEVQAEPVDLIALATEHLASCADQYTAERFMGFEVFSPFGGNGQFSQGQLKWLLQNANEFDWVFVHSHEARWNGTRVFAHRPGEARPKESFDLYLHVRPKNFAALMNERFYDIKFNRVYRTNLRWGLKRQDIIGGVDEDLFTQSGDFEFARGGGGNGDLFIGQDPAKWGEDFDRIMKTMRDRIAFYTRKVNALAAAKAKIEENGGFEAFLAKYRADLEAELRKEQKPAEALDEQGETVRQ